MQYNLILENKSSTNQTIDLFSSVNPADKQNRFTLPFAASYPPGTFFRVLIGSNNYSFTINATTTLNQLIGILNEKTFATWSIVSSGPGGNIIDCLSVDGSSEMEINITALPPVFVSAVTNAIGTQIEITFNKSMSNPTGKESQFDYSINSIAEIFDSAALKLGDDTTIVLGCDTTILECEIIEVDYTAGDVTSADGAFLASFSGQSVTNVTLNTFNIGTGFDNFINEIVIQPDGLILVVGAFTNYNGTTVNRIVRLKTDGSIDASFITGTGFNNAVRAIALQSDGKILVGGSFTDYDGTTVNRIVRLNSNGSIDNTFITGTGFNSFPESIAVQPDGNIVICGNFITYDGVGANRIIRLTPTGSIDGTFTIGTGLDSGALSLALQSDGKIVIVGTFTDYDGTGANRIVRLNTNGSIDGGFIIGLGLDSDARIIKIQTDGKILVGGDFNNYDGNPSNYIVRINTNGSIDGTFMIGGGFDNFVYSIAIQSDNKILAGGAFSNYDSNPSVRFVRLNANGTYDGTLTIGAGFDGEVSTIAIQTNSKIVTGGFYNDFAGQFRSYIDRMLNNGTDNTTI